MERKKIAIVGAGFCGLAIAWHLTQKFHAQIDLYDCAGIGGGASGIAAGLLHPYAGAHNKLNPLAFEGIAASKQLITIAENALNKKVANFSGILRIATDQEQTLDYQNAASKYPDIQWRTAIENQNRISGLHPLAGIFIETAGVIDSQAYLQGLFKACSEKGLTLIEESIFDIAHLNDYDIVIIAAGASCVQIKGLEHVKLNLIKGQVLLGNWTKETAPLPYPLNSYAYLLMQPQNPSGYCAGATFERPFTNDLPDPAIAIKSILPKVQAFMPEISEKSITTCKSGVRASTPNRLPLIQRVNDKCWVLSGMGSKGLLYHALYAEKLVREIKESTHEK